MSKSIKQKPDAIRFKAVLAPFIDVTRCIVFNDKNKLSRRLKILTCGQIDNIVKMDVEIQCLLSAEFGERFIRTYYNRRGEFCLRLEL